MAAEIYVYGNGKIIHLNCSNDLFILFLLVFCSYKRSNKNLKNNDNTSQLHQIHEMSISNEPVNCFDWSPDRCGLAVCSSYDKTLRIIASAHLPTDS